MARSSTSIPPPRGIPLLSGPTLTPRPRCGARLGGVISVDGGRVFKVGAAAYRLVEARCGIKPDKVCFLSSNCWDAHGAAHFGFRTVWVNRAGAPDDKLPGKIVSQVKDLSHLPALLGVA